MRARRGPHPTAMRWLIGVQLTVMIATGCTTGLDANGAAADYGARVATLAHTIRSRVVSIQSELGKPQPDAAVMQTAHAEIKDAYLKLNNLGTAPDGLADVHDLSIGAAFDCEYLTQQAIAGQAADLGQCLSEIEHVLDLTAENTLTPSRQP